MLGGEDEVVGRHLHRGDVARGGENREFIRRRDVQHVDALVRLAGQPDETLGAQPGGLGIAPDIMARRVALDAVVLALVEPVLVLGMEGGAAADVGEDTRHTLVVVDQQRAGG